jgi:hypothetical protein
MRAAKKKEEVEILNITLNEREAKQVRDVLQRAEYLSKQNYESRELRILIDDWLEEEEE